MAYRPLEIGYAFLNDLQNFDEKLEPFAVNHDFIKGYKSEEGMDSQMFMRCPIINKYKSNTFLVPCGVPSGHISYTAVNEINTNIKQGGGNQLFFELNFYNNEILVQLSYHSVVFFTEEPDVHVVITGNRETSLYPKFISGMQNIHSMPRTAHPSFHVRLGETVHLKKYEPYMQVTFVTPSERPIKLVKCYYPETLTDRIVRFQRQNSIHKAVNWKKFVDFFRAHPGKVKLDDWRMD